MTTNELLNIDSVTITRYDNRKMYSSALRKYVNYSEIADAIQDGVKIIVVTPKGDDITKEVMNMVLSEKIRSSNLTVDKIYSLLNNELIKG